MNDFNFAFVIAQDQCTTCNAADNTPVPLADYIAEVIRRNGHAWGWRTAVIAATQGCDQPVTDRDLSRWRNARIVPRWAYDQLSSCDVRFDVVVRTHKRSVLWTTREIDFLAELFDRDRQVSNKMLAHLCSVEFGRLITDNAIKGHLTRLRARGRIEGYRT